VEQACKQHPIGKKKRNEGIQALPVDKKEEKKGKEKKNKTEEREEKKPTKDPIKASR